jgi:hypothetical protein
VETTFDRIVVRISDAELAEYKGRRRNDKLALHTGFAFNVKFPMFLRVENRYKSDV